MKWNKPKILQTIKQAEVDQLRNDIKKIRDETLWDVDDLDLPINGLENDETIQKSDIKIAKSTNLQETIIKTDNHLYGVDPEVYENVRKNQAQRTAEGYMRTGWWEESGSD